MAIKHKLARLLPLLLLTGWMVKVSVKAQENGGDDDDPSQDNAISGWAYRTPKAQEPPSNVSDASFPFILIDPDIIQENKKHIYDYDRGLQHALWFLKKKADRYVANTTRLTVVNKQVDVPGNDKHDYMSLARYFWPNDSSPNGLPYIRKDGHVNPESKEVADYAMLHAFVKQVKFLALAYHYFDNQTYADKAIERINHWFIDPETRMNPHMQYASLIRGYNTGRSKGIIDFHAVYDLLDSISILQQSDVWNSTLTRYIRHWFTLYLDWLTHSPNGMYESMSQNNHGTYYDIQQASIYLFLNQTEMAKRVIMNATATRVAQQILPSGEQYLETARPLSWFYSIFNLRGLFQLGQMAQRFGLDLFNYETVDGKSIRRALDFLLPAAINESAWTFNNTGGFGDSYHLIELLESAYVVYQDDMYLTVSKHLSTKYAHEYNISRLTLPWAIFGNEDLDTFHRKQASTASLPFSFNVLALSFSAFALSFTLLAL